MYESPAHAFMPHVEGYAELHSITLARKIDDINARHAAETAKSARLTLAMVWSVTFIISLGILAGAAHWGMGRVERDYQAEARI